ADDVQPAAHRVGMLGEVKRVKVAEGAIGLTIVSHAQKIARAPLRGKPQSLKAMTSVSSVSPVVGLTVYSRVIEPSPRCRSAFAMRASGPAPRMTAIAPRQAPPSRMAFMTNTPSFART